jgi:hypothetical protein
VDEISKSSHVVEDEDENSKLQEENSSLLYSPYEDISRKKLIMKLTSLHQIHKKISAL